MGQKSSIPLLPPIDWKQKVQFTSEVPEEESLAVDSSRTEESLWNWNSSASTERKEEYLPTFNHYQHEIKQKARKETIKQ